MYFKFCMGKFAFNCKYYSGIHIWRDNGVGHSTRYQPCLPWEWWNGLGRPHLQTFFKVFTLGCITAFTFSNILRTVSCDKMELNLNPHESSLALLHLLSILRGIFSSFKWIWDFLPVLIPTHKYMNMIY